MSLVWRIVRVFTWPWTPPAVKKDRKTVTNLILLRERMKFPRLDGMWDGPEYTKIV
jgi:hypothetical protein